jgi:hypothetical protein
LIVDFSKRVKNCGVFVDRLYIKKQKLKVKESKKGKEAAKRKFFCVIKYLIISCLRFISKRGVKRMQIRAKTTKNCSQLNNFSIQGAIISF